MRPFSLCARQVARATAYPPLKANLAVEREWAKCLRGSLDHRSHPRSAYGRTVVQSSLLSSLVQESVMREIGAFEAKNKFGTLLDWVEKGEEIVITRRGKAIARLVPSASGFDREKAAQALARILARRVGATLGGVKLKDLVNEGRR